MQVQRSTPKRGSQPPLVSVLTACIPARQQTFLPETVASVKAQTCRDWEHLTLLDTARDGCATTTNRLAAEARGEWLFLIADDDILLPRCLELHLAAADADTAVVYCPPLVWGEPADAYSQTAPIIPSTALIRRSAWWQEGGYRPEMNPEDRDLWIRMLDHGHHFTRISGDPTWVYRLNHGGNDSRS